MSSSSQPPQDIVHNNDDAVAVANENQEQQLHAMEESLGPSPPVEEILPPPPEGIVPVVSAEPNKKQKQRFKMKNQRLQARGTSVKTATADTEYNATSIPEAAPTSDGSFAKAVIMVHHFHAGITTWLDKFALLSAILAWFVIGIAAIVTTKLLLQQWETPPILLTLQQLVLATIILRLVAYARDGQIQPWPWEIIKSTTTTTNNNNNDHNPTTATPVSNNNNNNNELTLGSSDRLRRDLPFLNYPHFIYSGLFNALDFLFSNYAFSFSAAHFVETIKASDPITTTAIALLWNVDRLGKYEAGSLSLLIAGVLLSTWGHSSPEEEEEQHITERKFYESVQTAIVTMLANLCFGFRAMHQKKYRTQTPENIQMDDVNFLGRLCQVGATVLILPVLIYHVETILEALDSPSETQFSYVGLSTINSLSFVSYNLASCFILSKLTVLHHSSLNCLRRMVSILATSLFFNKPMSLESTAGLLTSFFGFASFTYYRSQRVQVEAVAPPPKDSKV